MDKALEVIMVAVILVVASVVVISMLQGQTTRFGNYTDQQTEGSSCGLAEQRLASSVDCNVHSSSDMNIFAAYSNNQDCWGSKSNAYTAVCG